MEPGLTGNENDPDEGHYPFVRHVRLSWRKDQDGQWTSDEFDNSQWEVVCPQCGDTDGPAEDQNGEACTLRGPYSSHHHAQHVANKHTKEWATPIRWLPGSAFPQQYP